MLDNKSGEESDTFDANLSRCSKAMPQAEGVYQDGLPQHYTKAMHEKQK